MFILKQFRVYETRKMKRFVCEILVVIVAVKCLIVNSFQAINCVYECKEQIKIDSPAPDGFKVAQKDHGVIEINGQGTPETFEKILRNLVYVNTRRSPTSGRRPLQIKTTINKQTLPMLNLDIVVSSSDTTALKLSGSSRKVVGLNELQKYGIRIAGNLAITADNCLKYLDSARVEVDPPLSSEESLVNPGPLLDVFNLRKDNLPDGKGLIIRGLATLDEYKRVLREIVFVHLGLENLRNPSTVVYHNFKVLNACYFCLFVLVWFVGSGFSTLGENFLRLDHHCRGGGERCQY